MKRILKIKNILFFVATTMILFSLSSCVTKARFLISPVVPAAQGIVKVKKDKNKNYQIKIELVNLAEPNRLQPPKNIYTVWMVNNYDEKKKLGQIKSSTRFLSKKLTASFETVTTSRPIKIFILAENDANNQYPDSQVILSTKQF
jgi:hypothetical protein